MGELSLALIAWLCGPIVLELTRILSESVYKSQKESKDHKNSEIGDKEWCNDGSFR
jgi:hypothetical protein